MKTGFLRFFCRNCQSTIGFKTTSEPVPNEVYCLECEDAVRKKLDQESELASEYRKAIHRVWFEKSRP